MANYKKFLHISGLTEGKKLADLLSEITVPTGKYYKTIVFAAETNEIYNRGEVYGLSKADAKRITDLETATAALTKAQLAVAEGDKVLDIKDGEGDALGTKTIGATLSLDYGKKAEGDTKYLFLKGKNGTVISEIDATEFIKDKVVQDATLVEEAEEGISIEVPYIKIVFNEDVDPIRFSVKKLVDIYNAANILLTSAYEGKEVYTPANIKSGASMDDIVAELVAGIAEARANAGVTAVGGFVGAVTLKAGLTANGSINLAISENGELSATIVGLGTAAYTNVEAYATAEQGETADSAIQSIKIGTKTLTKENCEITAAEILADLDLSDWAKKEDAISATSTGSTYTQAEIGGTVANPTIIITEKTLGIADATDEENGLVLAKDAKAVTDALDERIKTLEDDTDWEEF